MKNGESMHTNKKEFDHKNTLKYLKNVRLPSTFMIYDYLLIILSYIYLIFDLLDILHMHIYSIIYIYAIQFKSKYISVFWCICLIISRMVHGLYHHIFVEILEILYNSNLHISTSFII